MAPSLPGPRFFRKSGFLLLLVPATLVYVMFIVYPLFSGLRFSLFNWDGVGPLTNYVGLGNFKFLFTSGSFSAFVFRALKHNLFMCAMTLALELPAGLAIAYMLSRTRWARAYQMAYFIPYTLSLAVVGFLWGLLLQPQWGLVNQLLRKAGLGFLAKPWLGSTSLALPTIVLVAVWLGMAFPIMVFYAGIIGIPQEVLEAARVDGASNWCLFWRMVVPLLGSTITLLSMLVFIRSFGTFDLIFVMQGAQAGPYYATDVLGTLFYRTAFGGMGATATGVGLASALAVIQAAITVPVSLVFARVQRRFTYEL